MVNASHLYALIGKEIKKHRETKKWTQVKLANQVGLTRTSITNIEKGNQKILVHTLWDLAEQLGVHPTTLIPKEITNPPSALDIIEKAKGITENDKNLIRSLITKPGGKINDAR